GSRRRLIRDGTPYAWSLFSANINSSVRLSAHNRLSTEPGESLMSFVDLVGKSVVVTGGARGIGRAIAHEFANAGADVVIGDFRFDEATKTALELSEVSGNRVVAVRTDVTSLEEVHRLRDEALRMFGKIDVLVNSA